MRVPTCNDPTMHGPQHPQPCACVPACLAVLYSCPAPLPPPPPPHTYLLAGTGKTLLAKSIAAESGVRMFTCSGTDFYDVYTGVGARRIRETFEKVWRQGIHMRAGGGGGRVDMHGGGGGR